MYGVECYGAIGRSFTLSDKQRDWAVAQSQAAGLQDRTSLEISDYRAISGKFDKIASVGMFEHVGPVALQGYFDKVYSSSRPMAYSESWHHTTFLDGGWRRNSIPERFCFPGAQIVRLIDVIRCAEQTGCSGDRRGKSSAPLCADL